MVRLIRGTQGSGKSTKLCEMIKNDIENTDKDVILIVPEQQSVTWTSKMSAILPPSANRRFTATTFTFLPNIIFRIYGGLSDSVVDEGTRSLIVWRAMLSVKEFLKVYKAGDTGREERAVPFLMNAIEEFRQSGISPAEAEKALEELEADAANEDDPLRFGSDLVSRLSDAVHVYGAYTSILHESFVDRGDVLDNLAKTLQEHPYFRGKSVYLDSFFSLSRHEENILKLIIEQADDVTVTCASPTDSGNRDCPIVFDDVEDFRKTTESMARERGREVEYIDMEENLRHKGKNEFLLIDRDLFSTARIEPDKNNEPKNGSENVKIIKCSDRFDEAEACASVICKLLREGYKYSDIAVIARNIETREGIIDNTLRRHGIKCFISESTEVSSSPAVKLVLAALGVAAGGWKRRDVIRLYKTGMTPCGRDASDGLDSLEGDVFENYTYTWNIRGRKSYCTEWTMNPDGYTGDSTELNNEILRLANSARVKIISPLDRLLSVFGDGEGVATVRTIAEQIYYFAEDYSVDAALTSMAENYESIGMLRDADRTRKSWKYVVEILEKMVSVLGETPLNVIRFARLFASVASGMDKGTIPTGVDEVILGSSSSVRLESVRCVILIGSVNDEFPAPIDDSAHFFNDSDKQILENYDIKLCSPTKNISLSREYFMYYRSVLSATDKLYILAPVGNGAELSSPAKRIVDILAVQNIKCVESFSKMPLDSILFDKVTAEYLISRRTDPDEKKILRTLLGETGKNINLTAVNDMIPPAVGRTSMALSNSSIENFVGCPFAYCCERVMKLKPEKKAEINPADIGIFFHSVLEKFFQTVSIDDIKNSFDTEKIKELADGIVKEYISSLSRAAGDKNGELDGRLQYLMDKLSKYLIIFIEKMADDFRQSKFKPVAVELPIGLNVPGKEKVDSLRFRTGSGVEVFLHGIADRVDVYTDENGSKYVRVVDYKTGKKDFDIKQLSDGVNMQMLIYLYSIMKNGLPGDSEIEYKPAGVEYIKISASTVSYPSLTDKTTVEEGVASLLATSGIFLNESSVIDAMDSGITGQYINIAIDQDNIKSSDKHTFLRSAEEFGEIKGNIESTITDIASRILEGHAEASPSKSVSDDQCGFCKYAYVCKARKESRK